MKLEWSEPAVDDLTDLHDYIAKDSPHYARLFIERLLTAAEALTDFPEMGRRVPETDVDHIRELIVEGYRVIYQVDAPGRVVVLTVVHGRRDVSGADVRARALK